MTPQRERRGHDKIITSTVKTSANKHWAFGKYVDISDRIIDAFCDLSLTHPHFSLISLCHLLLGSRTVGGQVTHRTEYPRIAGTRGVDAPRHLEVQTFKEYVHSNIYLQQILEEGAAVLHS